MAQGSKPTAGKRARRTYRSKSFPDEGEAHTDDEAGDDSFGPLPDDTFDGGDDTATIEVSEELKKASEFFKEVDKWELDFEEVVQSSSPQEAR